MARILIADDAMFMRATLKKALTGAGHEIVGEAETGKMACELYASTKPDLVLMDITMPVMDGLEALRAIVAEDASARIIMCTALGQQEKVMEALTLGAKDYVVKPFSPDKLSAAVARALAG